MAKFIVNLFKSASFGFFFLMVSTSVRSRKKRCIICEEVLGYREDFILERNKVIRKIR